MIMLWNLYSGTRLSGWLRHCLQDGYYRISNLSIFLFIFITNRIILQRSYANVPLAINKRLTEISSDEESFRHASQTYQTALDKSRYEHQLKFKHPLNTTTNTTKRNRSRNIIWYNPPFSTNVATNIGKTFLKIVDEEFPLGHTLHKILAEIR